MATRHKPQLRIDADITRPEPQATRTLTHTVHWDEYDQRSHQLYSEGWKVIGADSGTGEDGTDDTITGRGAADIVRFSSEGRSSTEREIVIELDVSSLDEDPGSNTDEIKVEVSLDPVGPFAVEETSNRVLVSA